MVLPDVLAAFRTLLVNQTSAGARVSQDLPRDPTFPYLTYRRDGGPRGSVDNRLDTARLTIHAWGATDEEAYTLALEVRDVLMPPSQASGTYTGAVGEVFFTGGELNAGPAAAPDELTATPRYVMTFLMHYARAA